MTARTFNMGDRTPFERKRSGVRGSGGTLLSYDLTVIATDVEGVVDAAGGWLCDRVRAGWQVTVLVPPGRAIRPLTILGLHVEDRESGIAALHVQHPVALAVDAGTLRDDEQVRREVNRAVEGGDTEVTVWGESPVFAADPRFAWVRHPLSAAARAFKEQAMLSAAGATGSEQGGEEFLSCALWYPPAGIDLVPVRAGR